MYFYNPGDVAMAILSPDISNKAENMKEGCDRYTISGL